MTYHHDIADHLNKALEEQNHGENGSPAPSCSALYPLHDAEIQRTSVPGFSLLQWDFITRKMRIPQVSVQIPTEAAEQIIQWRDQQNGPDQGQA